MYEIKRQLAVQCSLLMALIFSCGTVACADPISISELRALRSQQAHRQRRVIFNNDGNEPVYLCENNSPDELLRHRTAPLAKTTVDSIFYCTWSSGFGMFTHDTRTGHLFKTKEDLFSKNRIEEMIAAGTDPLQVMVDFGKKNGIEIFWSFRMNDTHDAGLSGYGPVMFRANPLKQAHLDWLLGTPQQRPRFGGWSGVDYTHQEVRQLALQYVEEVCQRYEVDGIELDFFRHPVFFKRAAQTGTVCNDEECRLMTSLLRDIRNVTEREGLRRGKPILLAVRVPDSAEYSKDSGLDVTTWLKEGLVDLLIGSGYFQLNEWETTVTLGHQYSTPAYASLDESRVKDKSAQSLRMSIESYRGRVLNARRAGADGIYMFNAFNPRHPIWSEAGDIQLLESLDQDYFASVRGIGSAAGGALPHRKYQVVPTLTPQSSIPLMKGSTQTVGFQFGMNLNSTVNDKLPQVRLRLQFDQPAVETVSVSLNDVSLTSPVLKERWLEFELAPNTVKPGTNLVSVQSNTDKLTWQDLHCTLRWKEAPAK